MLTRSFLLTSLTLASLGWGQISIQKAWQAIKGLQKISQETHLPRQARLQSTAWVVDSMWRDTTPNGGTSWDEVKLVTHAYYPNAQLERDSSFIKNGFNWTPDATTSYYYNVNLNDSLHLTYAYDGTAWQPAESLTFTYTLLPSGALEGATTSHAYQGGNWEPNRRQVVWYSGNPPKPDSASFDTFNVNTSAWDRLGFARYLYDGQNQLDSIKIWFALSGGVTLWYYQKNFYDTQNRLSHLYDTLFIPTFNLPIRGEDEFFFYTSSSTNLLAVDSLEIRNYYPPPSYSVTTTVRYTYDPNDNLILVLYEDCTAGCVPFERERYVYKQLTVTDLPGMGCHATFQTLCKTGDWLEIPVSWQRQPYELYLLSGQLVQKGQLGSSFMAPTQPGLYILKMGTHRLTQRLYVFP